MSSLTNLAITNMSLSEDGRTVTLTRGDGQQFQFVCKGVQGTKGPDGDKGPTGPRGESAFEIAARLALTTATTASAWLASLKGDKGATGSNGTDGDKGPTGQNGTVPSFQIGTTSWLAAGNSASLDLTHSGSTYTMTFGVPSGANGSNGANGSKPTLSIGTVTFGTTNGGDAAASLTKNGNAYSLNMTIPKGSKGVDATGTAGADAYAPQINFVVNYVANGTTPSVAYSDSSHSVGNDWTRTVTLNIPRGVTGDTGPDSTVSGTNRTYGSANYYSAIVEGNTTLNNPSTGLKGIAIEDACVPGSSSFQVGHEYKFWWGMSWKKSGDAYQFLCMSWVQHEAGVEDWARLSNGSWLNTDFTRKN